MNDFLGKYYPSIKRKLHESRIENLRKLLSKEVPEMEGTEERPLDIFVRLLRLQ